MEYIQLQLAGLGTGQRLLLVILVAFTAHLTVVMVRKLTGYWMSRTAELNKRKAMTLISLVSSSLIFVFYFAAVGFVLSELGVPITAYFASASVIGLAVGFGSQGMVQDVVTGLTTIFSSVYDVGDMVEIGGQIGVIRYIGLRFIQIENSFGARVLIPNRSVTNVINYRRGYIRCIADVTLPENIDAAGTKHVIERLGLLAEGVFEQFPGILISRPSIEGEKHTSGGRRYLRIKFRIWPGRGAPIETTFKQEAVQEMKKQDDAYQDWMVTVYYEVETKRSLFEH